MGVGGLGQEQDSKWLLPCPPRLPLRRKGKRWWRRRMKIGCRDDVEEGGGV